MYPLLWTFLFLGLALSIAVLEIFVPSGGILAVLSVGLLITSIVFSFQINIFFGSLYMFVICLCVPVFLWITVQIWSKTWIGKKILLEPENDPALSPDKELLLIKQLVGKQGIAKSKMLLSGQIEIEDKRYNAVSDAEPIESGDVVHVLRIEGTHIVVRKINPAEGTIPPVDDPFAVN